MNPDTEHKTKRPYASDLSEMFRPPVNRAMRVLDRSFFKKTIPLSAATIFKPSDISSVRKQLEMSKDMLGLPRMSNIQEIQKDDITRKCMLLSERIKHDGMLLMLQFMSEILMRCRQGDLVTYDQ